MSLNCCPCVRLRTLIRPEHMGELPAEEEDMIKPNEGAKSPKLDQLQTNIVLGLQELQDHTGPGNQAR